MNSKNIILGCLKNRYASVEKGTGDIISIESKEDIIKISQFSKGKSKDDSPALVVYRGKRGDYKHSNTFFIDIDTRDGVDTIIENKDELFKKAPWLYFIQKSHSGKLHICGIFPSIIEEREEWSLYTRIYTVATIHIIDNLFGVDYYNIEGALDTHSFGMHQLLYVSENEIFFNDNVSSIKFSDTDIDRVFEKYPNWKPEESTYSSDVDFDGYVVATGVNKNKIIIDRNFKIGNYSGYEVRWRISVIAKKFFGSQAKSWCDQYFCDLNGKSIFTKEREEININRLVLNWLEDNGYISSIAKIEDETVRAIKYNQTISDYKDIITDFIKKNKRCAISAPTGSGKTYLINNYLATELNAVVIVPFNAVNELYDNLYEVSTEAKNQNTIIPSDQPVTLVIDQAIKHKDELIGRQVIIDESHVLYSDRSYRDKAVLLMNYLIENKDIRVCCISATLLDETRMLNCNNILKFRRERSFINVDLVEVTNVDTQILGYVNSKFYDRIVVFSDRFVKKIYENLMVRGCTDVSYICADEKGSDDFEYLRKNELLNKKITLLTRIGFNGLNFNNKGEKVLIICTYKEGRNIPSEIIQSIGRFRNCKVNAKIILDGAEEKEDVSQRISRAELYDTVDDYGLLKKLYDSDLLVGDKKNVMREIESFVKQNSTIGNLKSQLEDLGYVNLREVKNLIEVREGEEDDKKGLINGKMHLKVKRNVSDKFLDDLIGDNIDLNKIQVDYDTYRNIDDRYYNEFYAEYSRLNSLYGINKEHIEKMRSNTKQNTLVSTLLNNLADICFISSVSEDDWNDFLNKENEIEKNVVVKLPSKNQKMYFDRIKQLKNIRTNYGFTDDIDTSINMFLGILDIQHKTLICKLKDNASKGGKKTGKNVKRLEYDGKIFESCKAVSDYAGVSINSITNWIKKGIIKEL